MAAPLPTLRRASRLWLFLDGGSGLHAVIIRRCGNHFIRKTSRRTHHDLDEARLQKFVSTWRAAETVADKLVLIGPGTSSSLRLPPFWDMGADTFLATLKSSAVLQFGSERMWAHMEKLSGDAYHARASIKNARLIVLHLVAHIKWALLDTDSMDTAVCDGSLSRVKEDKRRYVRSEPINQPTLGDFIVELKTADAKESEQIFGESTGHRAERRVCAPAFAVQRLVMVGRPSCNGQVRRPGAHDLHRCQGGETAPIASDEGRASTMRGCTHVFALWPEDPPKSGGKDRGT